MSLGQRLRGFEYRFPLIKLKLQNMPERENAKRNGLSLAASVGGMLLVSSTTRTGEPGLGRWPDVALRPGAAVLHLRNQLHRTMFLGNCRQMNS